MDACGTYQSKFISPEGRVIDDANGGISHSEGQGYGMLIAVRGRRPRSLRSLVDMDSSESRIKGRLPRRVALGSSIRI